MKVTLTLLLLSLISPVTAVTAVTPNPPEGSSVTEENLNDIPATEAQANRGGFSREAALGSNGFPHIGNCDEQPGSQAAANPISTATTPDLPEEILPPVSAEVQEQTDAHAQLSAILPTTEEAATATTSCGETPQTNSSAPTTTTAAAAAPAAQAVAPAIRAYSRAGYYADRARGEEIIESARVLRVNVERDAQTDHTQVSQRYSQITPAQMQERLNRAAQTLREQSSALMSGSSKEMDRSDLVRFALKQSQGADLAQALGSVMQDSLRDQAGVSQFNLIGGTSQGAAAGGALLQAPSLARGTQERADLLQNLFGQAARAEAAPTNDGLVFRNVLYGGLTQAEREAINKRLKLSEEVEVKQGDAPGRKLMVLHNGYILGAGKSGTDCSAFVTRSLPPEVRQARFTTLDFKMMWLYARKTEFPKPPLYDVAREETVKRVSKSFVPVDVVGGEPLKTGDLLVYRLLDKPIGHVFLVRSYNPRDLTAEVIEASQSAGTVRERKFYLSIYPEAWKVRPVRRGLFALRLKPLDNAGCRYSEAKRK